MKVDTVSQLLRVHMLSTERLDAALRLAAPRAMRSCSIDGAGPRASTLRDAVIGALPQALQVGIPECICHRWWPLHSGAQMPTGETIEWTLNPQMEWLHEGKVTVAVAVVATVRLVQRPGRVTHDAQANCLTVGSDRVWSTWLHLGVADAGHENTAMIFHESRCDVYLPPGPWALGSA